MRIADKAGHWRFSAPKKYGGKDGSNLWMAVIRDHFAAKGLGLHNDLQNEMSIVGNFPFVAMFETFGTPAQQEEFILGGFNGTRRTAFGLTEPDHGSDATFMETRAVPETRNGVEGWLINGEKMWTTGMHVATHCATFCRTSGADGAAKGITCLLVPTETPGLKIEEYLWTFNMPTDHPRVSFTDVWVPATAMLGQLDNGLALAQSFVHQNRIRQAASSLGAASYCIEESVKYARERKPFGEELARNQAIQFPLVELATQCEMLRLLIRKTAWEMDRMPQFRSDREGTLRQDQHVQLLGEPPRRPGRRSRDAGARRHRLFAPQAVRAHLSPPPPLSHHRRLGRNPDARGAWSHDRGKAVQRPQPMIDFTAMWLLKNLPHERPHTLVHGDFRNGNLIVDPDAGVAAVLDWELAHVGDPMRDLGWLMTRSWRFGASEKPVGGFGETDDLFEGYESVAGHKVDRKAVRFWEVFGSFWWAVGALSMGQSFRNGSEPSVERPVIGRRSSECQIDCVNMLIPGWARRPEAATDDRGDLPTSAELLTGVRDFLKEDAQAGRQGRSQFLARVAANATDIVLREMSIGPDAHAWEAQGLSALLGGGGPLGQQRARLCAAIRAGDIDLKRPDLHAYLRDSVFARVMIDQPGYAGALECAAKG
jgi:alkylation response protein AidB-like acyl-CoA dehydrogenase